MGGECLFRMRMRKEVTECLIGALLNEVPKEGDGLKIQGSAMVALASSKEEVLETLKKDIYAESNVWDFSKVGP